MLLPLFYYRTYATQDVAAEVFGVGQATVSRSIDQIAPVVRQCIPIPAKIYDRAKRASTLEELEEVVYRNPLKEVRPDQRRRVRIGKSKTVAVGRTGSLTEMGLKSRVGRLEK